MLINEKARELTADPVSVTFRQWLQGETSAADPECQRAILAVLDLNYAPTADQMRALTAIWEESKKNKTMAMMLAFMLGEIVGKHKERRLRRAAAASKAKRTAHALIDQMDEQSLKRLIRFGFKIKQGERQA